MTEHTTGHTINGKHTAPGHKVHYQSTSGTHEATIDSLEPDGTANLTANVNGSPQKFTGVPHRALGGVNTWDHAQSA